MSSLQVEQSKLTTASLLILAGVAATIALIYTKAIMIPLMLAIFIFYMVAPLVDLLNLKWKVPQALAVALTLLAVLALMSVLGLILSTSARGMIENADTYSARFRELTRKSVSLLDKIPFLPESDADGASSAANGQGEPLSSTPADQDDSPRTAGQETTIPETERDGQLGETEAASAAEEEDTEAEKAEDDATITLGELANPDEVDREDQDFLFDQRLTLLKRYILQSVNDMPISRWLGNFGEGLLSLISNSFLVLIFLIFLLLGRQPERQRRGLIAEIDTKVRQYLVTKFLLSAATGILVGFILFMVGLDLALVFGVLVFLLNFIPNIGSIVATLLPLPVALIQFSGEPGGLLKILIILLLPGAVQMTIGNVVEPKVLGDSLDLHPVVVLAALVFWGLVWGPVGMLLAAPITAVLRIVLIKIETTRPIGELLSGRLPEID